MNTLLGEMRRERVACASRTTTASKCALGWACWKTYLGRPEWDWVEGCDDADDAATEAEHHEDAMAATLTQRRIRTSKLILISQNHLDELDATDGPTRSCGCDATSTPGICDSMARIIIIPSSSLTRVLAGKKSGRYAGDTDIATRSREDHISRQLRKLFISL